MGHHRDYSRGHHVEMQGVIMPWPYGHMLHTPQAMFLMTCFVQQMLKGKQCGVSVCQPAVSFAESASDWLPWRRQLPAVLPPAEQLPLQLLSFPAQPALLPSSYLYLPAHPPKQFEGVAIHRNCNPALLSTCTFSYEAGFDCHLGYSQVLTLLSSTAKQESCCKTKLACLAVAFAASKSVHCPQCINAGKFKQHLQSGAHVSIHSKFEICMNHSPSEKHCSNC